MFSRVALFELRYQWRRPIGLISPFAFAMLAFLVMSGRVYKFTGSEEVILNASQPIANFFAVHSIYAMLVAIALFSDVALRDLATRMDEIMRTQPRPAAWIFGARFAGSYVTATFTALGLLLGAVLALDLPFDVPWMTTGAVGPFRATNYIIGLAVVFLPTLFACGALFFTVASLTRSLIATYLTAVVLVLLLAAAGFLKIWPAYHWLAALIDPFGLAAISLDTRSWSSTDLAGRLIPLDGFLIWNRLMWTAVGSMLLALSFTVFAARGRVRWQPRQTAAAAPGPRILRERPATAFGGAGIFHQLALRTWHEFRAITAAWSYLVLLLLALAACVIALMFRRSIDAMSLIPINYFVFNITSSAFSLFAMGLVVIYCGELIWRDRSNKIAAIIDATPTPSHVFQISKIAGLALTMVPLLIVVAGAGIGYQLAYGVSDLNLGFHLIRLVFCYGLIAVMCGVLALFIHNVVNQKFVGLLIVVAVLAGAVPLAQSLGIKNELLLLFEVPDLPVFEMSNYGRHLPRLFWFCAYWACVSVIIAVASNIVWVRGENSLLTRLRTARRSFTPATASVAGLAVAATAATASYLKWG